MSASLPQLRVVRTLGGFGRAEQEIEQLSDFVGLLQWVPHPVVSLDEVVIAPADALPFHVPRLDQVGDYSLRRPLGDPDQIGNVANPDLWVTGDTEKHVCVACHEAPVLLVPAT
jgi:hypothetical protein